MNAGLAALLGALVGALGTGGAAVVTGFLGRSQARMQLHAEHVRVLREPRRSAYVAFVQCFQEVHALHSEVCKDAFAAAAATGPERRSRVEDALHAHGRAGERLHGELQKAQAVVAVEGPPDVTEAALSAEDALLNSRGELHRWVRLLEGGTATDEHERTAEDALLAVHRQLVRFLGAASAALAHDGLRPRPDGGHDDGRGTVT